MLMNSKQPCFIFLLILSISNLPTSISRDTKKAIIPKFKYYQVNFEDQEANCKLLFEDHPLGKLILKSGFRTSLVNLLASRVQLVETYRRGQKEPRWTVSLGCGFADGVTCFPDDTNIEEKRFILAHQKLIHSSRENIPNATLAEIDFHDKKGTFFDVQISACAGQWCENNKCSCLANDCRIRNGISPLAPKGTACIDFDARPIEVLKIRQGDSCKRYENKTKTKSGANTENIQRKSIIIYYTFLWGKFIIDFYYAY